MPVNRRLRILLVEDHETVRQGLKLLIDREADFEVVGEASDGAQAIERGAFAGLDVVVMDISMPGVSGVVATRKLKELRPNLPDREPDPPRGPDLPRRTVAGRGVGLRPQTKSALRVASSDSSGCRRSTVHRSRTDASPRCAVCGRNASVRDARRQRSRDRETEVLRFVSQGHSNKEIAARLDLSNKTIEVHKANAMRKLGLSGRIELLQYALHVGWLHDP